jgi:hypothetical protein
MSLRRHLFRIHVCLAADSSVNTIVERHDDDGCEAWKTAGCETDVVITDGCAGARIAQAALTTPPCAAATSRATVRPARHRCHAAQK